MKNTEKLPSWLVIAPRTGESVEVDAATRGAAARAGSALLTLTASTLELDTLAREVVVIPMRAASARPRERFTEEAGTSA